MHTIEAAVLVPLGLGLLTILLMLTFYLHDQTVLAADYGAMVLDWQHCTEDYTEEETGVEPELGDGLLITEVSLEAFSPGKQLFRLKARETWKVFQQALGLLTFVRPEEQHSREITLFRVNALWIKRIWRASGLG